MTEHTPGPWTYFELDPPERCINCSRTDFGHFLIPDGHGNGECALYTKADARLIAAAPELLAACEAAQSCIETPGDLTEAEIGYVLEDLCIAIAKAKTEVQNG